MTHVEQIIRGIAVLVDNRVERVFSREDVRRVLGIPRERWNPGYNPIFQAMRIDQPGGAPSLPARYRELLEQRGRGHYALTSAGRALVKELAGKQTTAPRSDRKSRRPGRRTESMRQVVIYRGEDAAWVAECPSLPGCISQGTTRGEAIANVREAIQGYIAALEEDELAVPEEHFDTVLLAV